MAQKARASALAARQSMYLVNITETCDPERVAGSTVPQQVVQPFCVLAARTYARGRETLEGWSGRHRQNSVAMADHVPRMGTVVTRHECLPSVRNHNWTA